eukprot:8694536-Alexandrium_andersonii.AAC.1
MPRSRVTVTGKVKCLLRGVASAESVHLVAPESFAALLSGCAHSTSLPDRHFKTGKGPEGPVNKRKRKERPSTNPMKAIG